ncbi:MAG: SHOCT domain-containing protein [Saprospiraceae bacterium]
MSQEDKQTKASEIIKNHVGFSLGAALIPLPGADLLALSGVQLNMLRQMAKVYNVSFFDHLGKTVVSAIVGGSAARLGASLVKAIPGVGTIIGELSMPILSGASTWALGRTVANHLKNGGTLENLDLIKARKTYETEIEEGKKMAQEIRETVMPDSPKSESDQAIEKIQKLAEMKDAGILSEEEFKALKERLLGQI